MEDKQLYKEKVTLHEVELDLTSGSEFMSVDCPSCCNPVPSDHINITDKIAKCGHCAVVFSFDENLKRLTTRNEKKQTLHRPEGINIYEFNQGTDIEMTQPFAAIEGLPYTVLPIILFFSTFMFFDGKLSIMWMSIFLSLNLGLIAYILRRKKHKINIHIGQNELNVQWRPKKLISDKRYKLSDIKQFYVKNYDIYVIVDGIEGSKHINLIPGLHSLTKAHYLEQELERILSIKNEPVIGEDKSS